jgi:hypothetical protein
VHVHVSDSHAVAALQRALHRGRCATDRIDEQTVRVIHLDATDAETAAVELQYFLCAWQAGRPGVVTTLLP